MFSAGQRINTIFVRTLVNERFLVSLGEYASVISGTVFRRNLSSSGNVQPVRMSFASYEEAAPQIRDDVPVIVMHGLFGSKMNWNSLAKVIHKQTNKKVYTVDARNHGESPHSNEHTYTHLAEDIHLFMTENKIEKAALVGHSMGGRAVMAFALQHPSKVESLTVVDISPVGVPPQMSGMVVIFDAMKAVKIDDNVNIYDARKTVEIQLTESLKDSKLAAFLSMNLIEKKKGEFSWKVNLEGISKNYHPGLTVFPTSTGVYDGPTIFICGAHSDFVNFNDIDDIKKLFPKAFFVTIENSGHWIHADQPKLFLDSVCKFLKDSASSN
ncbi:sn-1-specific diacylglycerol lipase ABHD11-like [Lycorma delicatula]|uniref:sn-1-specific diacylglycerol lipase ABHD11-like n=1 Tax=Lycorma delicatula TaxID=130591 RepID=UPI003F50FDEB